MNQKEAYHRKLQARLNEWEAGIAALRAKAGKAQSGARSGSHHPLGPHGRIEELQAKLATAKGKLDELQRAGQDAWKPLQEGIENAWDDLGDAMNSGNTRIE